ncbi:hypothetical protein ACVGW7_00040, partial [Enterobacter intestinihominis]
RNVSTPITNPLRHDGFLNTSAATLFLAKRFASGAKNEERDSTQPVSYTNHRPHQTGQAMWYWLLRL